MEKRETEGGASTGPAKAGIAANRRHRQLLLVPSPLNELGVRLLLLDGVHVVRTGATLRLALQWVR